MEKTLPAPKGNQYWQFRNKHGRDYAYQPEELWAEFVKYCEWVEDNPLKEVKLFANGEKGELPHIRPYTLTGFCVYADISLDTFEAYRKNDNKDFAGVTKKIDEIIYSQKFEGAATGFYNPVIIARDLGLAEKKQSSIDPENNVVKLIMVHDR